MGDVMAANVKSGLVGGLIAAVIWMMITTAVGMDKLPVILGGFLFLVGTWAVTSAISTIIGRSRRASA